MLEKTLYLWFNSYDYMPNEMRKRGINVTNLYANNSVYRRAFVKFKLPFQFLWYSRWKKHIGNYDTIIMGDLEANEALLRYIKRKKPSIRIIIWYWNTITDKGKKAELLKKMGCEVWSFDMKDCKSYNLNYNTQFYSRDLVTDNNVIRQDVFFIGMDKGRLDTILDIENKLKQLHLKTNFYIVKSRESKDVYMNKLKERINYNEVVKNILESKSILDLPKENQSGLTLRPLEALFFSKKLITTNKDIVKYDFYNKNNIFVIGIDPLNQLPDFLNTEYEEINQDIVLSYDINAWFNRFFC